MEAGACPASELQKTQGGWGCYGGGGRRDRLSFSSSSRRSFRHTLAGGISLTLLAVLPFEFFSDFLYRRAHGHGWVTE
jgi:hypothetical protein